MKMKMDMEQFKRELQDAEEWSPVPGVVVIFVVLVLAACFYF